ncbi:MAG: hypothetical protein ACFFAO_01945 [Candidatus Hermodarchaeota archaeon]
MKEIIYPQKSTVLRKNNDQKLKLFINEDQLKSVFLINNTRFITENLSLFDLEINPHDYYMIINNANDAIEIEYDLDVSNHQIVYNPFKHENSEKINLKEEFFKERFKVPKGYIDTLPKWYSFKFTYPEYNLIFIKPELGISIQIHESRSESWEIIAGKPIILSGNIVYYYVKKGTIIQHSENTYHTIINPNKDPEAFVMVKERWSGNFMEEDIQRVFNPNNYY